MLRSWRLAGFVVVCGVAVAVPQFAADSPGLGFVDLAAFCLVAGLLSPLVFPRPVSAAQAQKRSTEEGRPIVYWRPGCQYCLQLRAKLGRDARRVSWVNIWADPDGAAAVRAVTGGDETVPTVVLAGEAHVNPQPRWLREQVRAS